MRFYISGPQLPNYHWKSFPTLVDAILYAKPFTAEHYLIEIYAIPF